MTTGLCVTVIRSRGSPVVRARSSATPSDTARIASARGYQRASTIGSTRQRRARACAERTESVLCSLTATRTGTPARSRAQSAARFE